MSCTLKYYLAFKLDKIGFSKVIKGDVSMRQLFDKKVMPDVWAKFPLMLKVVRRYYEKRGRELSLRDYETLVFMRVQAMYDYRKGAKKIRKKSEHPDKSKTKSRKSAGRARILMKSKTKTYDDIKRKTR